MKKKIYLVLFIIAIIGLVVYGIDRLDRINNGEMTIVSEDYMDR